MSGQFWLTYEHVKGLRSHFPRARGKSRVDDRLVLSGLLHVLRNGLRWRDAPTVHGPLYDRVARRFRLGVFARMFRGLAQPGAEGDTVMMDIEPAVRCRSGDRRRGHLKAHRTAASLREGDSAPMPLVARKAA